MQNRTEHPEILCVYTHPFNKSCKILEQLIAEQGSLCKILVQTCLAMTYKGIWINTYSLSFRKHLLHA